MKQSERLDAPHLSWRNPLARWRHIARSPAYRLGATIRWKRWTVALTCLAVELVFAAIAIWCSTLGGPVGHEIREQSHALIWGWLVLAACAAGAFSFHPERSGDAMEQLILTPMESYDVIRDRAFASAAPLAPAVVVAVLGCLVPPVVAPESPVRRDSFLLDVVRLDGWCWLWLALQLFHWGLAAVSGCAAVYLAFAIGVWSGLRARSPFLSLPLALLWMAVIGAAFRFLCSHALVPTLILAPFFHIIVAGLFLAGSESLFRRQRLPGESENELPTDPEGDAVEAPGAER